ncbi:MAG: hypothetical protein LBP85_01855 [Prevotellaceae bacterium]|jgi:hypothetical protein|nr:hypothetical protein [Prevotellaceae bacterium]
MAEWNQYETLEAWAKIVIERWEHKISNMDVISEGELLRSFQAHVTADSNGNAEKITFTFAYYGRFAELGVGKGVKAGMESARKKKPWYTKVFFGQVNALARIMAEKYGQQAALAVVENIEMKTV